jgi:sarcosine oxidase subunit alpha
MHTPVEGLFVAGNIAGVEGAAVAMAQGIVAARSIASYLGVGGPQAAAELAAAQAQVERARAGAPLTFYPQSARGRAQLAHCWAEAAEASERRAAGAATVATPHALLQA